MKVPFDTTYSKKKPCPICGNDGCKKNVHGLILCLRCDSKEAAPQGYLYHGQSKDGQWGQFAPLTKLDRETKVESIPLQRSLPSLSLLERGQAYNALIQKLPLYPNHVSWLKNRGYSDDFIEYLFSLGMRSYDAGRIDPLQNLSPSLPGVNLKRPDTLCCRGLLLPFLNWDGQLMGFQYVPEERIQADSSGRKYDKPNKYNWVSSGPEAGTLKLPLPYDSNPHAFFQPPVIQDSQTLGFTEGALKGAYTAYTLGQAVLSTAGGGNFNIQQLDMVIKTHKFTRFVLYPDAGMMDLKHISIAKAYFKLSEMLKELGFTLLAQWWGQDTKEKLDIDDYLMTRKG